MIRRLGLLALVLVTLVAGQHALAGSRTRPAAAPEAVAPEGVGETDHLTPGLHRAITRAIAAAQADGVELRV
ncbi:MAG: hypothetical protein JWO76_2122, partial [Nocardioides sp.]|nr:hypothetical protein [Nocardioides sp.]